jgi:glycosyltransferase involved in cell wall biosynthesis
LSDVESKITIGLPIYNGEKFIEKRLKNILSQSFQNFEIIIYDSSTDATQKICENHMLKDDRIHYFHEKKRSGWIQAFLNLMKKDKYDYFIIASVDDLWSSNFLEENILELEQNPSAVASIGIVENMSITNNLKSSNSISSNNFTKIKQWIKSKIFTHSEKPSFEAKGPFKEKARKMLRNTWYRHINGVIRSSALSASIIKKEMFLWDWAFILNLVKLGDLHMTKNSKYLVYTGDSTSRSGHFQLFKSQKIRLNEYFAPASTFTFWCIKKIGFKFFLSNFDYFIWLNFIHIAGILSGLYQKLISFLR